MSEENLYMSLFGGGSAIAEPKPIKKTSEKSKISESQFVELKERIKNFVGNHPKKTLIVDEILKDPEISKFPFEDIEKATIELHGKSIIEGSKEDYGFPGAKRKIAGFDRLTWIENQPEEKPKEDKKLKEFIKEYTEKFKEIGERKGREIKDLEGQIKDLEKIQDTLNKHEKNQDLNILIQDVNNAISIRKPFLEHKIKSLKHEEKPKKEVEKAKVKVKEKTKEKEHKKELSKEESIIIQDRIKNFIGKGNGSFTVDEMLKDPNIKEYDFKDIEEATIKLIIDGFIKGLREDSKKKIKDYGRLTWIGSELKVEEKESNKPNEAHLLKSSDFKKHKDGTYELIRRDFDISKLRLSGELVSFISKGGKKNAEQYKDNISLRNSVYLELTNITKNLKYSKYILSTTMYNINYFVSDVYLYFLYVPELLKFIVIRKSFKTSGYLKDLVLEFQLKKEAISKYQQLIRGSFKEKSLEKKKHGTNIDSEDILIMRKWNYWTFNIPKILTDII